MLRITRDRVAEAFDAEPPKRFFLYLDQGEELYTRPNRDEARQFSALLAEAAGHDAFSVLMSLLSDYYAAFQGDHDLFAATERVDVLPMSHEVLVDVIRKPALTLGAWFESDEMAPRVAEATERFAITVRFATRHVAQHAGARRRGAALVGQPRDHRCQRAVAKAC